jgi:hypothetical protein
VTRFRHTCADSLFLTSRGEAEGVGLVVMLGGQLVSPYLAWSCPCAALLAWAVLIGLVAVVPQPMAEAAEPSVAWSAELSDLNAENLLMHPSGAVTVSRCANEVTPFLARTYADDKQVLDSIEQTTVADDPWPPGFCSRKSVVDADGVLYGVSSGENGAANANQQHLAASKKARSAGLRFCRAAVPTATPP